MMQNSSFDDTIKDYNITIEFMTENLQRGTHEEQNTHTVVTSDFQKLEFPYTMNERHSHHSDEDGISDGAELGNEKWINITEFVKRTYEDAVRKGDPHKATFEAQVEDIIEKNGAYTDFNGNKVYGSVKWNDDKTKVLYRVYDYKSNPKLNDTDFDGIDDNKENEGKAIDNKFSGTSIEIGNVEYNQDFRWFYTNNQKYNDELAVMSLIMSNLADGKTVSTDQASGDIASYLRSIGFSNIQNIGEGSDNIYIAKKTIQYYDTKKDVVGVFFGKCDRWYSEVIKYKEAQKAQVVNALSTDIIESYINRIVNKVNLLDISDGRYWVAGYDVGGSIASEVASKLVEDGKKVYAYTFGALNTRESLDTKNEIKNIRNEDDFAVKFITGTKPGQNYGASIFENLMFEYRDLTGSSDYKGNYIFTNYLLYVYDKTQFVGTESCDTMLDSFDDYMLNFNKITNQDVINDFADLCMLMDKWADGNKQVHSIKSYYVLAKSLDGFDILDWDGDKQEHFKTIPDVMLLATNVRENYINEIKSMAESLKKVAEWYLENVATYQGKLQTVPLYQYKKEFKYLCKFNFQNTKGTGGDKFIMASENDDTALEIFDLNQYNGYLKTVCNQYKQNHNIQQALEYLQVVLPDVSMQDILRANEKQAKNYRENYDIIKKSTSSNLYYYPNCDLLNHFEYKTPGDDCTRFAFAVLEFATGLEANELGRLGDEANQFIYNTSISELNKNLTDNFEVHQGAELIRFFNEGLKAGDMLVGKKGIGNNNRNHCEFIYNDGIANQVIYNVFGWGQVKYDINSQAKFVVEGDYLINEFDSYYIYSTLYRKKTNY